MCRYLWSFAIKMDFNSESMQYEPISYYNLIFFKQTGDGFEEKEEIDDVIEPYITHKSNN